MSAHEAMTPAVRDAVEQAALARAGPATRAVTVEVNAWHVTARMYHHGAGSEETWDAFVAAVEAAVEGVPGTAGS